VAPKDLPILIEASCGIPDQDGGNDFMGNLINNIGDHDLIVSQLENLFEDNVELAKVLSSKPGLKSLWYDHIYLNLKCAVLVAEN